MLIPLRLVVVIVADIGFQISRKHANGIPDTHRRDLSLLHQAIGHGFADVEDESYILRPQQLLLVFQQEFNVNIQDDLLKAMPLLAVGRGNHTPR